MSFNVLITQNIPERRNPRKQRKPMHKVYLPSISTSLYASHPLYVFVDFAPSFISVYMHYQVTSVTFYSEILSRIQAPSRRHQCGSVTPPPFKLLIIGTFTHATPCIIYAQVYADIYLFAFFVVLPQGARDGD